MICRHVSGSPLAGTAGALLAAAFLAACGINMLPSQDAWYTQHYPIMQDFERSAYRTLSEAGRKEFQALFWAARDPESRSIFQERLDFVMNAFKRENSQQPWNTDRARVYLLNGPPAAIDVDQNTDWGIQLGQPTAGGVDRSGEDVRADRAQLWTYSFAKQYVRYAFVFAPPNEWRMAQAAVSGSQFIGNLEQHNKTVTFGIRDPEAYNRELEALEKRR
jgi:GWxTD domain-containing protein